ncbi:MAG: sulfurtransferase [Alcaligenaceae bacterium]|nr:sulfurtransferase [Alcaligenaceae bacterium]
MYPLISAIGLKEFLQKRSADSKIHLIDVRHSLQDPDLGRRSYLEGHLPGAVFFNVDQDLSTTPTGTNGRHPLPERSNFTALLSSRGMQASDHYIIYDELNSMFAARLWWMLRWVGCANVQVLNGGLAAWVAVGGELEAGDVPFGAAIEWQDSPRLDGGRVNVDEVEVNIRLKDFLVIDARSAERFTGEEKQMDPVAGHIPGAVNRPFTENLDDSCQFKSSDVLRREFNDLLGVRPSSEVVAQCGSGISACHNLLAMEIAGLKGAKLYAGSWSEWISDPNRPVATGSQ